LSRAGFLSRPPRGGCADKSPSSGSHRCRGASGRDCCRLRCCCRERFLSLVVGSSPSARMLSSSSRPHHVLANLLAWLTVTRCRSLSTISNIARPGPDDPLPGGMGPRSSPESPVRHSQCLPRGGRFFGFSRVDWRESQYSRNVIETSPATGPPVRADCSRRSRSPARRWLRCGRPEQGRSHRIGRLRAIPHGELAAPVRWMCRGSPHGDAFVAQDLHREANMARGDHVTTR